MKKVILIIRDGWGHGEHDKGNAQFHAKTPNHDFYKKIIPLLNWIVLAMLLVILGVFKAGQK